MPQSGITSVVVEHGASEIMSEPQPLLGDELSERLSSPPIYDEFPPSTPSLSGTIGKDISSSDYVSALSPLHEQQLEFLRYLVQQGVVNEGFALGEIPAQYQSKEDEWSNG